MNRRNKKKRLKKIAMKNTENVHLLFVKLNSEKRCPNKITIFGEGILEGRI